MRVCCLVLIAFLSLQLSPDESSAQKFDPENAALRDQVKLLAAQIELSARSKAVDTEKPETEKDPEPSSDQYLEAMLKYFEDSADQNLPKKLRGAVADWIMRLRKGNAAVTAATARLLADLCSFSKVPGCAEAAINFKFEDGSGCTMTARYPLLETYIEDLISMQEASWTAFTNLAGNYQGNKLPSFLWINLLAVNDGWGCDSYSIDAALAARRHYQCSGFLLPEYVKNNAQRFDLTVDPQTLTSQLTPSNAASGVRLEHALVEYNQANGAAKFRTKIRQSCGAQEDRVILRVITGLHDVDYDPAPGTAMSMIEAEFVRGTGGNLIFQGVSRNLPDLDQVLCSWQQTSSALECQLTLAPVQRGNPLSFSTAIVELGVGVSSPHLSVVAQAQSTRLFDQGGAPLFEPEAPQIEVIIGDADCNGTINNFDIEPWVLGLMSEAQGAEQGYINNVTNRGIAPEIAQVCWEHRAGWGDINGDGQFNNFDIDPFVQLLVQ